MQNRLLDWPNCKNVRDLGGLRALDGRATRFGAIVRADTPSRLVESGWAALYAYGVRTIVSLRTHGLSEPELDVHPPYANLARTLMSGRLLRSPLPVPRSGKAD